MRPRINRAAVCSTGLNIFYALAWLASAHFRTSEARYPRQ